MSGFFLKKSEKIFCLCFKDVLSLFQQTKKHTIMKKYIILTKSDWSFVVTAINVKEAEMHGRWVCRHSGEKFTSVRRIK